jgi:hypothetical protein
MSVAYVYDIEITSIDNRRPLNVNIFQKTILNTHEKNAFFVCFLDLFFCTTVRKAPF